MGDKGSGWHRESRRHAMASKGIPTGNRMTNKQVSSGASNRKRLVIVDIDGTILDTSERWNQALEVALPPSAKFWDAYMDSSKVKLDKPIPNTAVFLNMLKQDRNVEIVYLSGRRTSLMKETKRLMEKEGFPQGKIILRKKGLHTKEFKFDEMKELQKDNDVLAYVTDEFSEFPVAESLDIKAIKVGRNKKWSKEIRQKIVNET